MPAGVLPRQEEDGGQDHLALLLDVGATIRCTHLELAQFGVMGSAYARCISKVYAASVGLLNMGLEENKGGEVLAISEDSPWRVSKVKSFVSGNKYEFTVLLDTNGDVLRKYGLLGTPYTFVLNPEGEILFKHFGYRPGDEMTLRGELDKALANDGGGETEETSDGESTSG